MLLENVIEYLGLLAFLLRGYIKRQRVLVYPLYRGFLAEIRGKDDCLMIGTLRNSTLTRRASLEASPYRARAPRRAGLSQRERYQNRSFSANWICREVPLVSVITPADGLIAVPEKTIWFGDAKLA